MKAYFTLILILYLSAINAFSQSFPQNSFFGNQDVEFAYDVKQVNDQDYSVAANTADYLISKWADTVITGLNLNHSKKSGNEKFEVIDNVTTKLYYDLNQLNFDNFIRGSENINAAINVIDNDKVRIFPKSLNVNIDNYKDEAEQINISIDSNVVTEFHPEYQPINYTKEIPGQVPNGVKFLSVELLNGKTWIHKMVIKE